MNEDILVVDNLHVEFDTHGGVVKAVRGVDLKVAKGKTLAIVGESGCGKSVTMQAIMSLIPVPPGRIPRGSAKLMGQELIGMSRSEINKIRGKEVGMIFQDPMSALNPTLTIGSQISETLKVHRGMSTKDALKEAAQLLDLTRIPEAQKRLKEYPFQFSGGMLQRAMIAMSLACSPSLLIADEPTTALDVTIQAQILQLMREIQKEKGMSIVLITHDLGVVASIADDVAVMYAGQVVERGSVDNIFYHSAHPYTIGLKGAMPENDPSNRKKLQAIEGSPPDLFKPPAGCGYFARCPHAMKLCEAREPEASHPSAGHMTRCWLHHEKSPHKNLLLSNEELSS